MWKSLLELSVYNDTGWYRSNHGQSKLFTIRFSFGGENCNINQQGWHVEVTLQDWYRSHHGRLGLVTTWFSLGGEICVINQHGWHLDVTVGNESVCHGLISFSLR